MPTLKIFPGASVFQFGSLNQKSCEGTDGEKMNKKDAISLAHLALLFVHYRRGAWSKPLLPHFMCKIRLLSHFILEGAIFSFRGETTAPYHPFWNQDGSNWS